MQVGDVLVLKTTGERVIVLCVEGEGDSATVEVRRPRAGQDGIVHEQERFCGFELESEVEHLEREQNLFNEMNERRKAKAKDQASELLHIN